MYCHMVAIELQARHLILRQFVYPAAFIFSFIYNCSVLVERNVPEVLLFYTMPAGAINWAALCSADVGCKMSAIWV